MSVVNDNANLCACVTTLEPNPYFCHFLTEIFKEMNKLLVKLRSIFNGREQKVQSNHEKKN